jgi:hypothetical protein
MNFYSIVGQITAKTSWFLSKVLGFKNIKSFDINYDEINIYLKDNSVAKIRYLSPGTNYVAWSVQDFVQQAMNEKEDNWSSYFDESKFQEGLDLMISKHDATIGINWDVVSYYLNEYCKK